MTKHLKGCSKLGVHVCVTTSHFLSRRSIHLIRNHHDYYDDVVIRLEHPQGAKGEVNSPEGLPAGCQAPEGP